MMEETIAAIATPPGEGGLGVIRVSGAEAFAVAAKVLRFSKGLLSEFASHTIHYGTVQENGQLVDDILAAVFRAPHSFTGEDTIEISGHGGQGVLQRILSLLFEAGARPAEPGEFTKRAFLNGKMDLMQAEAVLDLIQSRSRRSQEMAVRQLKGALSQRIGDMKNRLMRFYAHLEAYLDFPEEDLEVYTDAGLSQLLSGVLSEMETLLAGFSRTRLLREGAKVIIAGKPNVGKSSLFNALLERDRALVSPYPGTTRDHLEEGIEIDGILIRLTDTAGFSGRFSNPLDQMGVERTRQALDEADLCLFLIDGSAPLDDEDRKTFEAIQTAKKKMITVMTKSDLPVKTSTEALRQMSGVDEKFISISVFSREGISLLEKEIVRNIFDGDSAAEGEQITRLRHRHALQTAVASLRRGQQAFGEKASLELIAFEVRAALEALKELIGEVYSEDLLDVIFSEFCIGK